MITLSVSDVDRAAAFYTRRLHPRRRLPTGRQLPRIAADSAGLGLLDPGDWASGPDPDRRDYASFADFADPDGNTWTLQEIGRISDSSTPVAHVPTE
ncbi:hypothetical protein [Streptomyces mirabilis]|uniref:hypothetical protein n=1 Tax=Streptomyces mirabilis TaxID=68239 RepID=UPI003F4C9503